MARREVFILVIALVVSALTGCGSEKTEAKGERNSAQKAAAMLDQAYAHLNQVQGLEYITEGKQKNRTHPKNKSSHSEIRQKMWTEAGYAPDRFHIVSLGEGSPSEEIYLNHRAMYLKDPEGDRWEKISAKGTEGMALDLIHPHDPKRLLKQLRLLGEDWALTQQQGDYLLQMEWTGESIASYIRQVWWGHKELAVMDTSPGLVKWKDHLQVKRIQQTIRLDAETFRPIRLERKVDAEVVMDGFHLTTELDFKTEVRERKRPLQIPAEVKQSAKEIKPEIRAVD